MVGFSYFAIELKIEFCIISQTMFTYDRTRHIQIAEDEKLKTLKTIQFQATMIQKTKRKQKNKQIQSDH